MFEGKKSWFSSGGFHADFCGQQHCFFASNSYCWTCPVSFHLYMRTWHSFLSFWRSNEWLGCIRVFCNWSYRSLVSFRTNRDFFSRRRFWFDCYLFFLPRLMYQTTDTLPISSDISKSTVSSIDLVAPSFLIRSVCIATTKPQNPSIKRLRRHVSTALAFFLQKFAWASIAPLLCHFFDNHWFDNIFVLLFQLITIHQAHLILKIPLFFDQDVHHAWFFLCYPCLFLGFFRCAIVTPSMSILWVCESTTCWLPAFLPAFPHIFCEILFHCTCFGFHFYCDSPADW